MRQIQLRVEDETYRQLSTLAQFKKRSLNQMGTILIEEAFEKWLALSKPDYSKVSSKKPKSPLANLEWHK